MPHRPIHSAVQHRSGKAGLEARSYVSDQPFPRHSHDQFGIGVMLAGAQRSWSCLGQVESGPGDLVMVNPGEVHDGVPIGPTPRRWHVLYVDPRLAAEELAPEGIGAVEIAPCARDPALAALILRLFENVAAPSEGLAVDESLRHVLQATVARHGLGRRRQQPIPPLIARALERIDDAPWRPASLAELAALAGTSRFQLLRGFAKATGLTPHAYLTQRRLQMARRLLKLGQRPAEVALAAGFADQSHLTRAFARQYGVTPARYRAAVS